MRNLFADLPDRMGVFGLYLFCLSAFVSKAAGNVGLALMFLAWVLSLRAAWPVLRRDPAFALFSGFLLYLAIRILWAIGQFPAAADRQLDSISDWLYPWLFLVVAWWFEADTKRISLTLGLALTGFFLGILLRQDWAELGFIVHGAQSGFGNQVPIMGLFSGTATLGLLLAGNRLWGHAERRGVFLLRFVLWLFLLAVAFQIFLTTQSITSWVGLLIVLPCVMWFRIKPRLRSELHGQDVLLVVAAFVVLGSLLWINTNVLKNRMNSQMSTVKPLLSMEPEKVPFSAGIGVRVHTQRFGIKKFLERPFLGWGPGTEVAKLPERPTKVLAHLHSTYLEFLARFGIVGALLVGGVLWFVIASMRSAYRSGRMPLDLYLFVSGTLAFLAIWGFGNFRMPTDWRFYCILFFAIPYTFRLHGPLDQTEGNGVAGGASSERRIPAPGYLSQKAGRQEGLPFIGRPSEGGV